MQRLNIFICNAPEDIHLREELDTHLSVLKRQYPALRWSNCEVPAGKARTRELDKRLNEAHLILPLISPAFLASDYGYTIVTQRALERHQQGACVIPILLRYLSNWKTMQLNTLQTLPLNSKPIMNHNDRGEAFQKVVAGIQDAIENLEQTSSPAFKRNVQPAQINQQQAPQKATDPAQQTIPPYYIYISDAKIEMLSQQWHQKDVAPVQNRYETLHSVLHTLQTTNKIGDIQSNKPYISGAALMRWGTIETGAYNSVPVTFFFSGHMTHLLFMAGSAYHLTTNKTATYAFPPGKFGADGSSLPGIMGAIQFAAAQNLPSWAEGVGSVSDYLFILGMLQEKLIDRLKVQELHTNFPEQKLQFVARVHSSLQCPSEQQLHAAFKKRTLSTHDQKELRNLLRGAKDILLCSPLYVALDDSR